MAKVRADTRIKQIRVTKSPAANVEEGKRPAKEAKEGMVVEVEVEVEVEEEEEEESTNRNTGGDGGSGSRTGSSRLTYGQSKTKITTEREGTATANHGLQ
eukprot:NODE_9671_length_321_cov_3.323529_g9183_i0.p1 GENE.NODE_9671_length_321_cov_3.323529_g9183_i0~~NODE_9671_length_321_cov_3.323529_g9183_i0.p1  ORF type:complete len:100 (-),score=14.07 NODE_9671_length_321_cov_3.323529_g9183_i0:21-320(-)